MTKENGRHVTGTTSSIGPPFSHLETYSSNTQAEMVRRFEESDPDSDKSLEDDMILEDDELDDEIDEEDEEEYEEDEYTERTPTTTRSGRLTSSYSRPVAETPVRSSKKGSGLVKKKAAPKAKVVARKSGGLVKKEAPSALKEEAESDEDIIRTVEDDDEDIDFADYNDSALGTPDPASYTSRQRARFTDVIPGEPTELPPEPSKKRILTEEEQALRRAELARRRKNLSERRLEEEKQETLNKLLKKRAAKSRKRDDEETRTIEEDDKGEVRGSGKQKKSRVYIKHPAMASWRSTQSGFSLSFTEERAKIESL